MEENTRNVMKLNFIYYYDVACLLKKYRGLHFANKVEMINLMFGEDSIDYVLRKDGLTIARTHNVHLFSEIYDPFNKQEDAEEILEIVNYLKSIGFKEKLD